MTETLFPPAVAEQDDRLAHIHRLLLGYFDKPPAREPWDPLSQFIYSLLSSRTKTETTYDVVRRLRERFGSWEDLRDASLKEIEAAIADVTFPEQKAVQLEGCAAADHGALWDVDAGLSGSVQDRQDTDVAGAVSGGGSEDECGGGELQHIAAAGAVPGFAPSEGDSADRPRSSRGCEDDGGAADAAGPGDVDG